MIELVGSLSKDRRSRLDPFIMHFAPYGIDFSLEKHLEK
jgi:hypothetical protein